MRAAAKSDGMMRKRAGKEKPPERAEISAGKSIAEGSRADGSRRCGWREELREPRGDAFGLMERQEVAGFQRNHAGIGHERGGAACERLGNGGILPAMEDEGRHIQLRKEVR